MKVKLDPNKLYYSIGEVSELFNVSSSLIRYWESEFPLLKPQKNSRGDRRFTQKDIIALEVIYKLLKEKGYTIEGAKKSLSSELKVEKQTQTLIKKLEKIRDSLEKMKQKLDD